MLFLEPFSTINNTKHDTWPFRTFFERWTWWRNQMTLSVLELITMPPRNLYSEGPVYGRFPDLSHLSWSSRPSWTFLLTFDIFFFGWNAYWDAFLHCRQLNLICNTSACGRQSPASFNQSANPSGRAVNQSGLLGKSSVFTPPTCFVGVRI